MKRSQMRAEVECMMEQLDLPVVQDTLTDLQPTPCLWCKHFLPGTCRTLMVICAVSPRNQNLSDATFTR